MDYSAALKRNELLSHGKTWRKLQFVLLRVRSQTEKAAHCVTPAGCCGKGKTMGGGTKTSDCQVRGGVERMNGATLRIFKAVKLFRMIHNGGHMILRIC